MGNNIQERPWLFQKGNDFERLRKNVGRKRVIKDEEEFLEYIRSYVGWAETNPIPVEKIINQPSTLEHFDDNGTLVKREELPYTRVIEYKARPLLICGLCSFIGITEKTFYEYRKYGETYRQIIDVTIAQFKRQKIEGSAAGIFKERILALEMNLVNDNRARSKQPKKPISNLTKQERRARMNQLLLKAAKLKITSDEEE